MKKLIAILFLSLIYLAIIPGNTNLLPTGYELAANNGEGEAENKEGNKEIKEFTVSGHKPNPAALLFRNFKAYPVFILPQPLLHKPTPPPDRNC